MELRKLSFESFCREHQLIEGVLTTIGGEGSPHFGHAVVVTGGAGSGKAFIKDPSKGGEGYGCDADVLTSLSLRAPAFIAKVKAETGFDISAAASQADSLRDPDLEYKLSSFVSDLLGLDDLGSAEILISTMTAAADRKPNVIFDVTLNSLTRLPKYALPMQELGYDKTKIHLVWLVKDIQLAIKHKEDRGERGGPTVPAEILINEHKLTSTTVHQIIHMGADLKRYMDGNIVVAFGQGHTDSGLDDQDNEAMGGDLEQSRGADYSYVKRAGELTDPRTLTKDLRRRIASNIPLLASWDV